MQFKSEVENKSFAVRMSCEDGGKEIGRVRLVVIQNDLHKEPYGMMEDLFVEEEYRGKGIGKKLIEKVQEEAKKYNCYKLTLTCRNEKLLTQKWYEKLGFKEKGKSYRMDF